MKRANNPSKQNERSRKPLKARVEKSSHKHICIDPHAQMMALDLLSGDAFLSINKRILPVYGPSLTIFLSYLIDQFRYYHTQGKLQTDGSFFLRHQDIQNKTGITEYMLRRNKKELRDKGVITTIMKGVPQKEFYFLHMDKLVEEYQRINPAESKGLILPNPKEYNNNLINKEPNKINKSPLNHNSKWILDLFPQEWINNKSFQESIKDYIQHRKEKKSSLTKIAASRLAKKLTKYSIQEVTQALEKSMENGWQGVFPENTSSTSSTPRNRNKSKLGTRSMQSQEVTDSIKYPEGSIHNA